MSSSRAGAAPSRHMMMVTVMDQEACPSLDHGRKPSTQWALNPSTQFGASTSREGRTQRHPYPPVRTVGRCPPGGWRHREGRMIQPACLHRSLSETLCYLSCACHGQVPCPCTLQPPTVTWSAGPSAPSPTCFPGSSCHSHACGQATLPGCEL